ncbi:MAG: hypothetical protein ACK5GV_11985, partial [Bacteroidota bacterium]
IMNELDKNKKRLEKVTAKLKELHLILSREYDVETYYKEIHDDIHSLNIEKHDLLCYIELYSE